MSRLRVVLDECLPHDVRHALHQFDVETAAYAGLAGLKNGLLLDAISGRFDVLVTVDRNLVSQQKLVGRPFAVVVLQAPSNRMPDMAPLLPKLAGAIAAALPGTVALVSA